MSLAENIEDRRREGERLARECLERARQAAVVVAEEARASEAAGHVTPRAMQAMHDAELFRILLPRTLGGGELPPAMFHRVAAIISAADASAAWCLGQGVGCSMSAGFMDLEPAEHVFGPPDAVLAWGAGIQGKAIAVDGGYRVTGLWRFASGSYNATWMGGHSWVYEADGETRRLHPDGRPVDRTMLVPRAECRFENDWQVMGLRATASETYMLEDHFVPAEFTLDRDDFSDCRVTSSAYKFPTTNMYAAGFAGVALGNARSMMDGLTELARDKTPRGARSSLRDSAVFQSRIAEIEARYAAAQAYVLSTLERIYDEVEASGELTLAQRVDMRLATTHAINEATDLVGDCHRLAGSSAIFEQGAFERIFRDAHCISQQVQGRFTNYETVGRFMMGHEIDTMFV